MKPADKPTNHESTPGIDRVRRGLAPGLVIAATSLAAFSLPGEHRASAGTVSPRIVETDRSVATNSTPPSTNSSAVPATDRDVNQSKEPSAEPARLIAAERARIARLAELRKQHEAMLAELRKEIAVQDKRLTELAKQDAEQRKALEQQFAREEARWNANHITVHGVEYKIVRKLSADVTIKSNDRNTNFPLRAMQGEQVLFFVNGAGSDAEKQQLAFRLKRDRRRDSDPDVRKPMRHGDVWVAQDNYSGHGTRFYVKHENNRTVSGSFFVVSRAEPKPKLVNKSNPSWDLEMRELRDGLEVKRARYESISASAKVFFEFEGESSTFEAPGGK
jgi:hypothetical protein